MPPLPADEPQPASDQVQPVVEDSQRQLAPTTTHQENMREMRRNMIETLRNARDEGYLSEEDYEIRVRIIERAYR